MRCAVRSERLLAATAVFGLGVLLLGLWGSAEAEQKSGRKGRAGDVRCLEIRVTSPQTHDERGSRRFSATEILDLRLEVRLPSGTKADQQVTVKIFTPDGHLYQELPLATVDDQASEMSSVTRRRRVRADSERPTKASGKASALFPVAGTSIVTSSLYGQWTATASIDGTEASCARPTSFVITQ